MKAIAALIVLLALATGAAPAAAEERLAVESAPFSADAYGDVIAWSSYDAATKTYRLRLLRAGLLVEPAVASSPAAFDLDVGPGPDGAPLVVYARAGDLRSAFSMTEPENAGSDPTLLATTAVLEGDEWVINGHKWFSSNASVADFLIVMAVTDPEAHKYQRASMLLVPADTPGVTIVRDIATMEHPYEHYGRIGGHSEILYEDVRVPKDALLGARGAGFLIAQQRLGPGRIHHCMRWLGVSRRAFDMLCERALTRYAHGSLLSEKQTVQNWIADSAAQMQAARLMTLHAAWRIDTEGASAARQEIALIKFFGANVLFDVVDRALQIHGALGYSTDLPLEAMYRYARAARIYDGPDEVHRQTVARLALRNYTPPDDFVPSEHVPTRRAAAREKYAAFLS